MTLTKAILVLLLAALLFVVGCKSSKVQGGQARRETGGFTATYYPATGGRVTLTDDREIVATTQPSFESTSDKTLLTSRDAPEGFIGGFSLKTENFKRTTTQWGLIVMIGLLGLGFYMVGNYVGVIACGAGMILGFLAPIVLVFIAITALAWLILSNRKAITQLIKGNQRAIEQLPPPLAEQTKVAMATAQDANVQGVVLAVKGKMPAQATAPPPASGGP